MDYLITNDITKATHWIAYQDDNSPIKNIIIPNKLYELKLLKSEFTNLTGEIIENEEYFIKDENEEYRMAYMGHKGDYVIILK